MIPWRRAAICGLLGIAVHGLTHGQTQDSSAASNTAPTSTKTVKKTKHRTRSHASSSTVSQSTTRHTASRTTKNSRGKKVASKRGQQAIDSARATQIQEALIREKYMQGDPSGSWDNATQAAMRRYQADHGWQSKTIPDSRALIRLGLGPSTDHLLNPESAMTTGPSASDPKAITNQSSADQNLPKQ